MSDCVPVRETFDFKGLACRTDVAAALLTPSAHYPAHAFRSA